MRKKRIGVIFGGRSEEYAVSLKSAAFVIRALNPDKFSPVCIGITRQGGWKTYTGSAENVENDSWEQESHDFNPGDLAKKVDFVLPVLHGSYGEDGCIQGFLETVMIPYGGCGVLASAVCMDKQRFKELMQQKGFPVCRYRCFARDTILKETACIAEEIEANLGLPCFIKPANLGSSIGISKAMSREELEGALIKACKFDTKVLAEEYVHCRELEVAVIGNEEPQVTEIGEILPSAEFYDYDAKYREAKNASELIIPACITPEQQSEIKNLPAAHTKRLTAAAFAEWIFSATEKRARYL